MLWPEPETARHGGSAAFKVNGELEIDAKALIPEPGKAALVFDLRDARAALVEGMNEITVVFDPQVGDPGKYKVRAQEHHPDAPGGDPRPLTPDHFVTPEARETVLLLTLPV